MNDVKVQVIVKSPPSEIWKIWSNFSEAPLWDTDVRHCELNGPFEPGTRGKCVLKNGLNMPLKLETVSVHESYRNTARLLWIDLEFDHQMRRLSPNETQVIHSAKIAGPLSFLYRGPLRKMLTAAMTTALHNLCRLAEQRANAVGTPRLEKPATHLHRV
ncbi:SRPBCC family protein [Pseudomonas sp. B21-048]|uniref:SRPBCC family protein n=1 Tax=Pseudomonas sp. B21-048 TaxID=2895490 RepID=UPI00215E4126|nr:SRPBCC family protein [Pseudomonas sp. B21-048]UVK96654.1 polyketide cyclase [Pseudomonas sp. B21-048]